MAVGKPLIAVIDDDEGILDAMSSLLASLGYDAVLSSSGEAFLKSERRDDVTCVLTDVNLPGMSGFELQKHIRSSHPDLTIIVMTALSDEAIKRRAIAGGAAELLRKPIMVDDLIRCLETSHAAKR